MNTCQQHLPQVMRELQELAAGLELRFEVSRDPALCFEVRRRPVSTLVAQLPTARERHMPARACN